MPTGIRSTRSLKAGWTHLIETVLTRSMPARSCRCWRRKQTRSRHPDHDLDDIDRSRVTSGHWLKVLVCGQAARPVTIGPNCSFGAEQLRPHAAVVGTLRRSSWSTLMRPAQ
jgi:hypothetical protein